MTFIVVILVARTANACVVANLHFTLRSLICSHCTIIGVIAIDDGLEQWVVLVMLFRFAAPPYQRETEGPRLGPRGGRLEL